MDIGSTTRIPVLPVSADTTRPVATTSNAVRTELPPTVSVQQPPKAEALAEDTPELRPSLPTASSVERQLSVDIETRKVVFQALDSKTGDVIMQLPDPRALKAYADQRRKGEAEEAQSAGLERLA